jgi:hypothetical protein
MADRYLSDSRIAGQGHLHHSRKICSGAQPVHAVIEVSAERGVFSVKNPEKPQVKLDHLVLR